MPLFSVPENECTIKLRGDGSKKENRNITGIITTNYGGKIRLKLSVYYGNTASFFVDKLFCYTTSTFLHPAIFLVANL